MDFFNYDSKFKIKKNYFFLVWWGRGGRGRGAGDEGGGGLE